MSGSRDGWIEQPAVDDGFDLVVRVASGQLHDVAEIATVLAGWRSEGAT